MKADEAGELLEGFRTGTVEVLGALEGEPFLFVELTEGDRIDVPALFPAVVIGMARQPVADPGNVDVAVTTVTDPSAPWVEVGDLDAVEDLIVATAGRSPRASVALAQLLRFSAGRPIADGLAMESLTYSVLQSGPEFAAWKAGYDRKPKGGSAQPVLVDVEGATLHITLNRPEVHNAYNRAMRDALFEALALASADRTLSVEISGNGPSFCSGGDLTEFGSFPEPATAHLVRTNRSPARLLAHLSGRVRVRVHGSCVGSGIELPAFTSDVTAAPETRIALPEVSMGLIPGAGGTISLPRRIGSARTAWLGLTGQVIDARTALRWGLVDRVL